MGLSARQEAVLRKSIQECSIFQGKYYLWHIYHTLRQSTQPNQKLAQISQHLMNLIQGINVINNCKPSEHKKIGKHIKVLNNHYNALAQETGAQGILYNLRQTILCLGGCILGTIGAIVGGLAGGSIGFFNDVKARRVPTGIFFGAIAGAHVGASLGYRLPDRLIKDSELHALQYAIRELHRTFESLTASVYNDNLAQLKLELLYKNFNGDEKAFKEFLESDIPYSILAADAGMVLSEKVQGYLGHHIWVTFNLPGELKSIRIESGEELLVDNETNPERITQREAQQRSAKGVKLLEMLSLHRVLSPIYVLKLKPNDFAKFENIKNLLTFQYRNKPGVTDCNTFIDELLVAVNEKPTKTKRFKDDDKPVALWIRDAIRYLSPLPKELNDYESESYSHEVLEMRGLSLF
ncbi:MAG: hypothetical protein H0U70_06215 [Tatlockia sp.]|nr:hypothetical protein [Tatlockia sp.]